VTETPEEIQHVRFEYAALVSMCDEHLGKVLDVFDELGLWEDTMLIVNTDHGFLLGEHGWWAKVVQPFYNEVAHTPLFIWDPRCRAAGEKRGALVQTIDLAPTILDFFGIAATADMQGAVLAETIRSDRPVREAALYGMHGMHVSVTDGRYTYLRGPADASVNRPLHEYTHMPTHMRGRFSVEEMRTMEKAPPFSFTKGCPVMQIDPVPWEVRARDLSTLLFDLESDPGQENPIKDAGVEKQMIGHLVRLMRENDAPAEQFERLGLVRALKASED
jgi:arylsulfatase A-like enzyme